MVDYECKFCGLVKIKSKKHAGAHVTNCNKNPDRGKSFKHLGSLGKKISENQKNENIKLYNNNPKRCKKCDSIIPYKKRSNGFCNSKCSASYNNKIRDIKKYTLTEAGLESLKKHGREKYQKRLIFFQNNPEKYKEYLDKIKSLKTKPKVEFTCPVCSKIIYLIESKLKTRKYCSGTCRNKINNEKITSTRSKAEKMLEKELLEHFPNLLINFNDRKILNGKELDVYIPSLNFAIEWNGIYHHRNVRDEDKFRKTKESDNDKILTCKKLNINLYVVNDLTSRDKFIKEEIKKIIDILNQKLYTSLV